MSSSGKSALLELKRRCDMVMLWSRRFLVVVALTAATWVTASWAHAQSVDLPDGSKLDLSISCPVCSMKVASSTQGPAAVVFNDGKVVGFDGTGDFFRYLLDAAKYGFVPGNIKNLYVTEYGTKKFIEAKQAFFVTGSDVIGGMGPEVVAFSKKEDAEKFKADHHGSKVVGYSAVALDDLKGKKKLLKMKHNDGHSSGAKH